MERRASPSSEIDADADDFTTTSVSSLNDSEVDESDVDEDNSDEEINNGQQEEESNEDSLPEEFDKNESFAAPFLKLPQVPLYPPDGPSVADMTLVILSILIKHNSTDSLKTEIFRGLNLLLGTNDFPDNQYKLKKLYKATSDTMECHVFCKKCMKYVGLKEEKLLCPSCNELIKKSEKEENFFFTAKLKNILSSTLEKNSESYDGNFAEMPLVRADGEEKVFSDLPDGSIHASLRGKFGPSIHSYNIFGDAAPAFEASKKSIFALMLAPNFIKKSERSRNVKLAAIWVGRKEPDMNVLLQPFVKEARYIAEKGIQWTDHNGEARNCKIFPLTAVADSVARPKMIGSCVHNAQFGCTWCYHPNDAIGQSYNRYTFREPCAPLRTNVSWKEDLDTALSTGEPCKGVQNESVLLDLPGFLIPENIGVEQMHAADVGHSKTVLKLWTSNFRQDYYIYTPAKRMLLDKNMSEVRLPTLKNARLLTKFTDFKSWKASQAKLWTLHLSVPLLIEVQKPKDVAVWARFVAAYWLLNQSTITETDLITAQTYLEEHSQGYVTLYGTLVMTSNLHQSLHWPLAVARMGPLQNFSAYQYEGKFPDIKKDISSTKATAQQVMERAIMRESLPHIAQTVLRRQQTKEYVSQLLEGKSTKVGPPETRGPPTSEDAEGKHFKKALWSGFVLRTFESQKGTRKCDSCVQLKDNTFGIVTDVMKIVENNKVRLKILSLNCTPHIIKKCTIRSGDRELNMEDLKLPHLYSASVAHQRLRVVDAEMVKGVCILMEMTNGKLYVSVPPNNEEAQ
ncbi:uncharacterized protein LOC135936312 [Cloeon dipterum]|uniref:uncharacterized protein LOC135936312 n=1 Tax=Cloeon dipterum TaxID=197152 RepID=UPI0032202FBC